MALRRFKKKGWQIDYYSPDGKRVRKVFPTKKEAEAELAKRRSLIAEGRYLDIKRECRTSFEELAKKYYETTKNQRSFHKAKKYFIDMLLERFSGRMLSTITYYECEAFLNERKNIPTRSGKHRTASTLNKEVGTLRHMLKKGVSWGMIERSPFDKGESLHQKENNKRLRYLAGEEIETLLKACSPYLKDIVEVDLLTGMRRGELLSLKWSQIAGGFIYLHETKTDESRQIPIPKDLEIVLKRIRQHQWARDLKVEHVFCDDLGRPFKEVKRSFGSACKRAGIMGFRFHDLRHTFASHYIMRGGSIKALQKILGHKDIQMTMRYSHLSKEFAREEIQIMNGLTGGMVNKWSTKENAALTALP
ncbi:MAG: site-specific integrase [Deltaproteobacteria bacterium]|nr:site-specific integrase [Deltaproteobacteria bacterium]